MTVPFTEKFLPIKPTLPQCNLNEQLSLNLSKCKALCITNKLLPPTVIFIISTTSPLSE